MKQPLQRVMPARPQRTEIVPPAKASADVSEVTAFQGQWPYQRDMSSAMPARKRPERNNGANVMETARLIEDEDVAARLRPLVILVAAASLLVTAFLIATVNLGALAHDAPRYASLG
jgi:hypothetical protein